MGSIAARMGVADGLEDLMRHIRVEIESFFRDNDIPEYRTVHSYNQRTDYGRIFEVERMLEGEDVKECLEEIRKDRMRKKVTRGLDECCRALQEDLIPFVNKYSRELEAGKRGAVRLDVRVTQHGKWPQRGGEKVEDVVNLLLYEKADTKKGEERMIWSTWFGEEVLKEKGVGIVEYLNGRIDAVFFDRYAGSRIS